jgi:transglutaminase-like putative cysteine protease
VNGSARSGIAAALLFATSLLLTVGHAPPWCLGIGIAAVLWRLGVAVGRFARPRRGAAVRYFMTALTCLLAVGVATTFQTLNGLAAGTALLVVMGALKLLESQTRRDDAIVIGVALFLLLAAALADQSLWRLPLYLLAVWGAAAAIALLAHGDALFPTRAAFRIAARATLMSIPLALLCFAFFPRIAGQFWALQRGSMASTGLSDEMTPGNIDKLAIEYDPAFRVQFSGAMPPRAALYWRGPVLNTFDGLTWRRARSGGGLYVATPVFPVGDAVRYRVTLEPTNQSWWFALDTVDASPRRDVFLTHDRQLISAAPVTSVVSYDATSHLATRSDGPLSTLGRRYETRLPLERNPRARSLALDLRARTRTDQEFARAALDWFRTNGLEYTLEPGVTSSVDSVDTTLFDTKRGFCGHFASAYATLMRAGGMPARVVTGYLGGEWNPVGGYLLVRQADAHAWTEVWFDGQGWTRIDPTAVVAPERLQRGVYDLMADSLPAASVFFHRNAFFNRLALLWDGANQWWQSNVVEFNLRSQFDLLEKLGIDSPQWQHLGWAFALGLVGWIGWVALSLRRTLARGKPDRIGRAWQRATRKLAPLAGPRAADEGPCDFARRVGRARPELAARVATLAACYARLRFGPAASPQDIAAFERDVRQLTV